MPTASITLTVLDSITNAPVEGAQIFVNGTVNFDPTQSSVETNGSGQASFSIPISIDNSGNSLINVTASNYQSGSQIVNTLGLTVQSFTISLTAAASTQTPIALQFSPAIGGITWMLLQSSSVIDQGVSQQNGSATSNISLANGPYSISASAPGYQTTTQNITVNGQTGPYTIALTATADPTTAQQGNSNGNSTTSTTVASGAVSSSSSNPPNQSEYIYPNTDYDKYFTITGARIYIGNLFIDELFSIQYALQDNAVPIFGYASRYYDALAQGRSMVQGQLALNFVSEGYLYTVLNQYSSLLDNGTADSIIDNPGADVVAQVLGLMAARTNLQQQQANNPNSVSPTPALTPDQGGSVPTPGSIVNTSTQISNPEDTPGATAVNQSTQAQALTTQIQSLMATMTPAQIDELNSQQQTQLTTFDDVVGFDNAIYQDVIFDIQIEFGNEATGVKRVRYLEDCKLISNEQVLAQDGQTILDSYGFIARRLR